MEKKHEIKNVVMQMWIINVNNHCSRFQGWAHTSHLFNSTCAWGFAIWLWFQLQNYVGLVLISSSIKIKGERLFSARNKYFSSGNKDWWFKFFWCRGDRAGRWRWSTFMIKKKNFCSYRFQTHGLAAVRLPLTSGTAGLSSQLACLLSAGLFVICKNEMKFYNS